MFWKKAKQVQEQKREKVTRYSIRKYSFGAASVAVAMGFFAVGAPVQADAVSEQDVIDSAKEVKEPELASQTSSQQEPVNSQVGLEDAKNLYQAPAAEKVEPAKADTDSQAGLVEVQNSEPSKEVLPVKEKPVSYPASPVEKPKTAAMPRSAKEGQAIPTGTGFRADASQDLDVNGPGIEDATETPKVEKPKQTNDRSAEQLNKQISWLDFGDTTAWTGLGNDRELKVGATYKKVISPDYEVTLTVKSLKPFQATDVYKKRVEGTDKAGTYDSDAKNSFLHFDGKNSNDEAFFKAFKQNQWAKIKDSGFSTGEKETVIRTTVDGANAGVQFTISATYKGKAVKPTMVVADGEEASPGELINYITNGGAWEHIGEWEKPNEPWQYVPQDPNTMLTSQGNGTELAQDTRFNWKYFTSKDQTTAGLGTQVFGPVVSRGNTIPLLMTRGASQLGVYVTTTGQQGFMLGFMMTDTGDAPESYGKASHAINQKASTDDSSIQQPFIGTTAPDPDNSSLAGADWTADDTDHEADEKVEDLLPADQKGQTNGLIKLERSADGKYSLKVKANNNGTAPAYLRAWVDFNQDGKFDENEASDFVTVDKDGEYELVFSQAPEVQKEKDDKATADLATRVRIAMDQNDIQNPTGLAYTGEVEDFQSRITFPPVGLTQTAYGEKNTSVTADVEFEAYGEESYNKGVKATINQTATPKVFDNSGNEILPNAAGAYETEDGTYKLTLKGDKVEVTFTPKKDFVGRAKGINIRRVDSNAADTNWKTSVVGKHNTNTVLDNNDGRFVPYIFDTSEETTSNIQGLEHSRDLTFTTPEGRDMTPSATNKVIFFDATGKEITTDTVDAKDGDKVVGSYELNREIGKVVFKPNKDYHGTPAPITAYLLDDQGDAARVIYTPTVTPVNPVGQSAESTGLQGKIQTGKPNFEPGDTRIALSDDPAKLVDPTSQAEVDEVIIANQGKYSIAPDGTVTFTPLADFHGPATAIKVVKKDINGTKAETTYSPTVTQVSPTAKEAVSEGKQGQPQTGQPEFQPGHPDVALSSDPAKLVDSKTGQEVDQVTIDGQGTYTIDSKGLVTFTPEKTFFGKATAVEVVKKDINGTKASTTYTPTVIKVTPTAQEAVSTGKQGRPQTGTPVFTPGDDQVPFVEGAKLVDPSSKQLVDKVVVDGQGTYTIDDKGQVTFTPEPQFKGKASGVTLIRKDENGTPVETTYTPTVEEVTPTATAAVSTGKQGKEQTGTPVFQAGDPEVALSSDPAKLVDPKTGQEVDELRIPNQGTYRIKDGQVTFTPDKSYFGTATAVEVVKKDVNGTKVTTTYTPTVTKVTPTGQDVLSEGLQGELQTGKPIFKAGDEEVALSDDPAQLKDPVSGQLSSRVSVPNEGVYSIEADGTVSFTPEKDFVGQAKGVTVVKHDVNLTQAEATYKPKVLSAKPSAKDAETFGKQGQEQKGDLSFSPGKVLVNGKEETIPFAADAFAFLVNGQAIADKTLAAKDQTGKVVGSYQLNSDGTVSFQPNKDFIGDPLAVEVLVKDSKGNTAQASYQPHVTGVVPSGQSVESIGKQGQVQTGSPSFEAGDPSVPLSADPAKLKDPVSGQLVDEVTIPNQGTYRIAADGQVSFTPLKTFVGQAQGVTVVKTDVNGSQAQATYTPTVEPVTPTAKPVTSVGKQGQAQTGTPIFEAGDPAVEILIDADHPAKLIDPRANQVTDQLSVDALDQDGRVIGTYTLNPLTGQVTFQPNPDFVGNPRGVQVLAQDANGSQVLGLYTPQVLADPSQEPKDSPQEMKLEQKVSHTSPRSYPKADAKKLPETGSRTSNLFPAASLLLMTGLGLLASARKKKED
ncbi:CshA/CshB family fibrillar adhesin-related protein [Streptococcus oricebi]|uniref:Gram-positive cocci surface proteins LPxTG domain-containing protein n=1 Tax=Streptococcus oricebi TaxID=1547447 RepID=A0ABS5B4M8_9STRE|nr:CshA/CshB family fibrillar adhesin-related protein [Streptococcus oricebi]MBP2623803.1 hypothetical protein [Streptococcus oricebi]